MGNINNLCLSLQLFEVCIHIRMIAQSSVSVSVYPQYHSSWFVWPLQTCYLRKELPPAHSLFAGSQMSASDSLLSAMCSLVHFKRVCAK